MWLIDVCGEWSTIVGLEVQCRWETGLGLGLGELEEKWRKK